VCGEMNRRLYNLGMMVLHHAKNEERALLIVPSCEALPSSKSTASRKMVNIMAHKMNFRDAG
jgi:hypothetical protein